MDSAGLQTLGEVDLEIAQQQKLTFPFIKVILMFCTSNCLKIKK